ncbi:hypothetical protein POTOM_014941 [Populus tomentosa]|uniref:Gnk2-homologous domain-containing protein n=1 Tax=Populus tomentosa TaxID=118781 RepID=A0A8X7ZWR1_POPTO|nr:hypothetical protein POTOM_014941 [Populus tomentosa]
MKSLNFFIALLSLLSLATITKSQDPSYLYHVCSNETTYTRNSTYQANLNLLLSSLVSNATRNNLNGFYNSSIGLDPDDVYGLFLCRGDVSKNACHNCVALAAEEAIQRCPVEKVVILWYDLCLLRYSNRAFFSTMDQDPGVTLVNTQNIADEPERFNRLVATTMNDTATRATSVPSGAKKFAVKEVSFKEFQNLYSLVQCTPDLSSSDCNRCLRIAISTLPSCCSQKPGARVLYPSCNIRYEIYEFYNKTAVAAESPPPPPPEIRAPPPSPVSGSKGKVRVSTVVIIAIVVPVGVSIALFCLGFCFLRRRGRKNRDSVKENDDVYSFGVLILEIISGKKNSSFYQSDNGLCLVNYAWKQWKIGAAMELVDPSLGDSYSRNEITRCLHIALLCVQEDPNDRPTLTSVVLMLTSFSISLPLLREASSFEQSMTISSLPLTELESDKSNIKSKPLSVNDVSITELYPR